MLYATLFKTENPVLHLQASLTPFSALLFHVAPSPSVILFIVFHPSLEDRDFFLFCFTTIAPRIPLATE